MIEKSPKSEMNHAASSAHNPKSSQSGADGRATEVRTGEVRASEGAPNETSTEREAPAKLHEVVIAGVPLRLKSSHDQQTVNDLVALVDSKVREALHLTKSGSIQNAAILAALNLAEEHILLKRKAKGELDHLEAKAIKVISELENSRVTTGLSH